MSHCILPLVSDIKNKGFVRIDILMRLFGGYPLITCLLVFYYRYLPFNRVDLKRVYAGLFHLKVRSRLKIVCHLFFFFQSRKNRDSTQKCIWIPWASDLV